MSVAGPLAALRRASRREADEAARAGDSMTVIRRWAAVEAEALRRRRDPADRGMRAMVERMGAELASADTIQDLQPVEVGG